MNKQELKAKIKSVNTMDIDELNNFGVIVDLSTLEAKAKCFLYRAMENRHFELRERDIHLKANVVNGDLREGEVDV